MINPLKPNELFIFGSNLAGAHYWSDIYRSQLMKERGVDMSWYEKSRGKKSASVQAPLIDDECSINSINPLKQSGSLWTLHTDGTEHKRVRPAEKPVAHSTFICLCCKAQSTDFKKLKHSSP